MDSGCSSQILCSPVLAQHKLVCLQVMFFVGVQLNITAPPTPKADPSAQQQSQSRFAPTVGSADANRPLAATADPQESDTAQQPAMLPSPAASLQAQSQVHSAAMWHMCAATLSVGLMQTSSVQQRMVCPQAKPCASLAMVVYIK